MSTQAHTPGPWRAERSVTSGLPIVCATGSARRTVTVARVYAGKPGQPRSETASANARLIAAAPDMLTALKMARECIAYCRRAHKDAQSGEGVPVEFFLDAAIAKATGDTRSWVPS